MVLFMGEAAAPPNGQGATLSIPKFKIQSPVLKIQIVSYTVTSCLKKQSKQRPSGLRVRNDSLKYHMPVHSVFGMKGWEFLRTAHGDRAQK